MRSYLAMVLICKDEHDYLAEWLTYHFSLGVDHVILIDNGSRPPLAAWVRDWVDGGTVTVIVDTDCERGAQCRAYIRVLTRYGPSYRWMAFVDTDEFIVPKNGQTLPEFLSGYERFGGLGIFWHCFGSNGHASRQPSVLAAYTKRAADDFPSNNHVKSIVQPRYTWPVVRGDPHIFLHHHAHPCVDEAGVLIKTARRWPRTSEKIQINHYITRSHEDFLQKLRRGGPNSRCGIPANYFTENDALCNVVEDVEVLKVLERLKRT